MHIGQLGKKAVREEGPNNSKNITAALQLAHHCIPDKGNFAEPLKKLRNEFKFCRVNGKRVSLL